VNTVELTRLFVGDHTNCYTNAEHCNFVAEFCLKELVEAPMRKRDTKRESKLENLMKHAALQLDTMAADGKSAGVNIKHSVSDYL